MEWNELVIELKNGGNLFDIVSSQGWTMDKDLLINLVKELDYVVGKEVLKSEYKTINENLIEQIVDIYDIEY